MALSLGVSLPSILPKGAFVPIFEYTFEINYSDKTDSNEIAFNFSRVLEIYTTYPTASILCTCDAGDDSVLYNILPE